MSRKQSGVIDTRKCNIGTVFGQNAPLAIALNRNQNIGAIFRLEHAVGSDGGVRKTHAPGRHATLVLQSGTLIQLAMASNMATERPRRPRRCARGR